MITPRGASSADGLGDWGRDEYPNRIGPYSITGVLGKGGMGVVFDAIDPRGIRVALKVIRPQGDPENAQLLTARFLREAKILEQLDHPCVVRLVDSGDIDGVLFLAMERIEGVSLLTIRRRGALGFDPLVQLGIQLADALAHMHEAGIVHRDIKPANILIDARGQPVITDFGISGMSEATGITRMGDLLGSPGFMAPEVTEGHPPSELSDQFALGRLLYELGASGPAKKLPKNAPILEILSASLEIDWNRFPRGERWPTLESILRRMVATHPGERYPNARSVRASLQALTSADLLDSETLSEHVGSLGVPRRTAYEAAAVYAVEQEEPREPTHPDEPFNEETTLDHEDVTMPPPSFRPPSVQKVAIAQSPAATLPMDQPTTPDPPAMDDFHVSPADLVAHALPDLEDSSKTPPSLRPEQEAALSPSAVTLQDMPLFELAKREEAPEPQVIDTDDPERIVRLERQIARLREQLVQARKEALRPPEGSVAKTAIAIALSIAAGVAAGVIAASGPPPVEAPAVVLIAPAGKTLGDPKATYRGSESPTEEALEAGRESLRSALEKLRTREVAAAELMLLQCIETADLPDCHKLLGTLLTLRGDPAARAHFTHYLTIAPAAEDAEAIRRMLDKP
jgi:serine/threonine protein kinase